MPNIRYDIQHNIPLVTASAPRGTSSDNTPITLPSATTGFDLQNFEAVNVLLVSGTLADADATFSVELRESDATNGTYAAIDDANLIALESTAGFTFAEDNAVKQIGVVPRRRFLRVVITPANNTGASEFSAIVQGVRNIVGTV